MTSRAGPISLKPLVWLALALPALDIARQFWFDDALLMDLLAPSGEWSVRLLILALLPGPLAIVLNPGPVLRAWIALRRNIGVAAFCYGLLHLAIYCADMRFLAAIIDELSLTAIWTGWLALLLLAIPAAISFDRAMRVLGARWKTLQRSAYGAFALGLVHWLLLEWSWLPVLVQVGPLLAVWCLRLSRSSRFKGVSHVSFP
ncbi:ferric reductase-like transmembrane domain-containing protein [Novosphingobium aquimarinum]|uniref:ferric reductase-like transmembrane domain-containing protein n=1 Tax=Novosphingobium aquimarinum TaxID=2682494 RepID=UPI0012EB87A4|nr:ferric reductase-like transmembrane domain-containing protein [Novosphingobium aquimarinum]